MPKVSVAIASYNHERYVRASIQSVLDQSFRDFEILVTDDGSIDRTPDEVRSILDPRISLKVFPENLGGCVAANDCIRRSRGKYVAVLHSDDLFLPGKLAKQVAFLDENPGVGAVFAYPTFIDANGKPLAEKDTYYRGTFRVGNRSREEWLRHLFLRGNALCHPSVLIRKRCYDEVGIYNPALAQLPDMDMWIRVLKRFEIHVIEEPLVALRILDNDMNASAPRQEVVVRVQWELPKVLEQYLSLDARLAAKVFPEIAEQTRGTVPWTARLAKRLLDRYLGRRRPPTAVTPSSGAKARRDWPLAWSIGELALRVDQPAYALFGLEAMYRALPEMQDESRFRQFIASTGAFDPCGVLFDIPLFRGLDALRRTQRTKAAGG